MLTEEKATKTTHAWLDAWNRHDLDAILSHYADEIVFTSPFLTRITGNAAGIFQGKDALHSYFGKVLEAYPESVTEHLPRGILGHLRHKAVADGPETLMNAA